MRSRLRHTDSILKRTATTTFMNGVAALRGTPFVRAARVPARTLFGGTLTVHCCPLPGPCGLGPAAGPISCGISDEVRYSVRIVNVWGAGAGMA